MEPLRIRDYAFQSRLIVGSGKYPDPDTMVRAWEASGTNCITVALRRVDLKHEQCDQRRSSRPGVAMKPIEERRCAAKNLGRSAPRQPDGGE